ncbi:hypothetical protein ACFQY7_17070 [Actinomadura luteofluorescens]|uniref:hypothetical protein n=1 Tax=Actinomadura luteofluorescens TaxID=46163 RepID=UPI003638E24A
MIGVIDQSIAEADPWHDQDGQAVPRLAEMEMRPREDASADSVRIGTRPGASSSALDAGVQCSPEGVAAGRSAVWPVPAGSG